MEFNYSVSADPRKDAQSVKIVFAVLVVAYTLITLAINNF